ncbi:MAG: VTT domain-containing protein [Bacillaceae bacterium]|nr:VTT domain-containing protein [Bacillaceae bacterium]
MKLIIFLLVFILISIFLLNQKEWIGYIKAGDWYTLKELMGNEMKSILLITMGFMIMQNVFSLIPFLLLTMFNIWLFGFLYGYLWSLLGNILGSLLVFYLARYGLQLHAKKYNHLTIKKKIEENGFMVILMSRLIPIFPSSIINVVGGVSNIKAKDYILGTFIGHTIFVLILSALSVGIISLDQQYSVYIILIILVMGITILMVKKQVGLKIKMN